MLVIDKKGIAEEKGVYSVEGAQIFAKTLKGDGKGKTAVFIHGGGSGGNHTIVARPSYWLLNKGFFSTVIMPDRRGAGNSSPMTSVMTYEDNARDMKQLLDRMGVSGKVTAIGVSYGGPIALTMAAVDDRVEEVMLVASSPSLKAAKGLAGFLYRRGLLEKLVKLVYGKTIGTKEAAYPDFDKAYDTKNMAELKALFLDAIKHMEKSRLQSLLIENASTCDINNAGINGSFKIDVPVLRVIGTEDETWEVDLGDKYNAQIPNMISGYIRNAGHKDVFFRAGEFYDMLAGLIKK